MKKNKANGWATLLAELVAVIIAMILFSMAAPLYMGLKIATDRQNVVALMKRVQAAELYHTQIYQDGFRSPSALSSTRTFPALCESSGLLDGNAALPTYADYNLTFTFTGLQIAPASGCTVGGFQGFVMTAAPTNPANGRYYFLSSVDLMLRYHDGGAATITSNPWIW